MANEKRRLIDANALNWGRCPTDGKLAKAWLDEAPTVDAVEVVHASWIDTEDGETRCSNCEIRIPEMYSNADTVIKSECRFCHHCGAKMDGDGNE